MKSQQRHPDPYHVLVSEFMLQQTQVATVVGYFLRFIAKFPTVRALAEATEQEVLSLWQGLGYYRRARHLHAAARAIVTDHHGRIPDRVDQLIQLPGVGRYTAAAVASIAFGRSVPVVDGNVARVLTRWAAIEQPPSVLPVQKALWELAQRLVPRRSAGDFNQAMMELGATVCQPRGPRCLVCPVRGSCRAYQQQKTERIPATQPRPVPVKVRHQIIAVHRGARYLFHQRPPEGLWSNMWQLPTMEMDLAGVGQLPVEHWISQRFGLDVAAVKNIGCFEHVTTHRRVAFTVWGCVVKRGRLRPRSGLWRALNDLEDLPLANPQRRAVAMLG